MLQCPRCDHQVDGTKPPFRLDNLDQRTWCNQCKGSRFVRLWLCPCQVPWASCPIHAHVPEQLRESRHNADSSTTSTTNTTSPTSRRPATKRHLGQGKDRQIDQWLDSPATTKRARPHATHIDLDDDGLGPSNVRFKPHLIGPSLARRFAHLADPPPAPATDTVQHSTGAIGRTATHRSTQEAPALPQLTHGERSCQHLAQLTGHAHTGDSTSPHELHEPQPTQLPSTAATGAWPCTSNVGSSSTPPVQESPWQGVIHRGGGYP